MNLSRTAHGDDLFRIYKGPWTTWPQPAQAIVDGAGRRGAIPPMVVPPLSEWAWRSEVIGLGVEKLLHAPLANNGQ